MTNKTRVWPTFSAVWRHRQGTEKMEPNCQRSFNGERFMNDVELAKLLRISRRTLQEYRSLRILPYYLIQGKVLYKESEIQQLLEEAHKKCLDEQRKWL